MRYNFILSLLLILFYSSASANPTCEVVAELPDHYYSVSQFNIDEAVSGYKIEICNANSNVSISRVGPVVHLENTLYFLVEHLCYLSDTKNQFNEKSSASKPLVCNTGGRSVRMCSIEVSDCDLASSLDFIPIHNISVVQFNLAINELKRLNSLAIIDANAEFPNLDQKSLRLLKNILAKSNDLEARGIRFFNYSSLVYPGKITISAYNQDSYELVYSIGNTGMVLEKVGIIDF